MLMSSDGMTLLADSDEIHLELSWSVLSGLHAKAAGELFLL